MLSLDAMINLIWVHCYTTERLSLAFEDLGKGKHLLLFRSGIEYSYAYYFF